MASEADITAEIEEMVATYFQWNIGVTEDPDQRKAEHFYPPDWCQWNADTDQAARNVEAFFIDKGMNRVTGGAGRGDYVYIF